MNYAKGCVLKELKQRCQELEQELLMKEAEVLSLKEALEIVNALYYEKKEGSIEIPEEAMKDADSFWAWIKDQTSKRGL